MNTYHTVAMSANSNNSYQRLFQVAQENWQLWKREVRERRNVKRLKKEIKAL
ncbi:MAG: hypothetical protein IPK96_11190 [Flammeovirgaceae bacterium]|jgi:hypothetical protein|nr:hypothetical protein [Flammeovirgaceae bacterium]MDZ7649592.1 hypothetical protein [Cytophagales bacterium]